MIGDGYLPPLHVLMAVPIFNFRVSFRVSIRLKVKLDYTRLDLIRLKIRLTRLTSAVYMHLDVKR